MGQNVQKLHIFAIFASYLASTLNNGSFPFISVRMLVASGALLDISLSAERQAFCDLLKNRGSHRIVKHIIIENACRCSDNDRLFLGHRLMGGVAHFKGGLNILKLCHQAGFVFEAFEKLNEEEIIQLPQEKQDLVREIQTVPELRSLCRITLRSRLGSPLSKIVSKLGLPQLMQDYLMFTGDIWLT